MEPIIQISCMDVCGGIGDWRSSLMDEVINNAILGKITQAVSEILP
jgi:hypothetical protein